MSALLDHTRHRQLADAIEKMVCSGEAVLPTEPLAFVKVRGVQPRRRADSEYHLALTRFAG
eukprot:m.201975 g.201975  ORF g.201975 m.201975 type:complete len:61 (+) comp15354_c0_seq7:2592-2774(+)